MYHETLRSYPNEAIYEDKRGQKYQSSLLGTEIHDRELKKRRPDREHMRRGDQEYYRTKLTKKEVADGVVFDDHEGKKAHYGKHTKMIQTDLDGRGHGQKYEEIYDTRGARIGGEDSEGHIHRSTYTEGKHNARNELHGRGEKNVRLYETDINDRRKDKQSYQEYTRGDHRNGKLTQGTRYTKRTEDGFETRLETTGEHDEKGNLKSTGLMGKAKIKYKMKDQDGEHEINIDNAKIDGKGHVIGGDVTYKKDGEVKHKTTIKGRSYFRGEDRTHKLDPKEIQNYADNYKEPEHEDRYEHISGGIHDEEERERNKEQKKLTTTEKSTIGALNATGDDLKENGSSERLSAEESVKGEIRHSGNEEDEDLENNKRFQRRHAFIEDTPKPEFDQKTGKMIQRSRNRNHDITETHEIKDDNHLVRTQGEHDRNGNLTRGTRTTTYRDGDKEIEIKSEGEHDTNGNLKHSKSSSWNLTDNYTEKITRTETDRDGNKKITEFTNVKTSKDGHLLRGKVETKKNDVKKLGHIRENYTDPPYGRTKPFERGVRTTYLSSSGTDQNPLESDDIKNNIDEAKSSSLTNTEKSVNSASKMSFAQFEETMGSSIPEDNDEDQESTITSNAMKNVKKASSYMGDVKDFEEDF